MHSFRNFWLNFDNLCIFTPNSHSHLGFICICCSKDISKLNKLQHQVRDFTYSAWFVFQKISVRIVKVFFFSFDANFSDAFFHMFCTLMFAGKCTLKRIHGQNHRFSRKWKENYLALIPAPDKVNKLQLARFVCLAHVLKYMHEKQLFYCCTSFRTWSSNPARMDAKWHVDVWRKIGENFPIHNF